MTIGEDKSFKTAVTLLLAGLTFVTSLIVTLNVQASNRGAAATRDARLLGVRYLTHLGRSSWDAVGERELIGNYQEVSGLMMQAQVYESMAHGNDAAFYKMIRESLAKSQALLLARGEVTRPPYFTPAYGAFNYFQYVLDHVSIPATEILQRQEEKRTESSFWGAKSDAYATGLAIMVVAVFLLTLSLVLTAHVRFVIAGAGTFLAAAVLVVAGLTTVRPWRGHADESIRILAKASANVLTAQMVINWNGDTTIAAAQATEARAAIDKILETDKDYVAAILLRARAHSVLGEAQYFAATVDGGRAELDKASADLDQAIAEGKTDGYTYWSKGYVNFLLGRHTEAEAALDRALALLPDQKFSLGLVMAGAFLYAGRVNETRALTEEAIEFALKKPLGSDAMNLRAIIKNLVRFDEIKPIEGLPVMIARLKEAEVCLAVLNRARPAEVKAEISTPAFVAPVYDNAGNIIAAPAAEVFKSGTARAYFQLELKGMEKGRSIVRKVYRRAPGQVFWIEQLWLGRAEHWDGPAEARLMGSVENQIPEAGEVLARGDYRLEIYIDGALKAKGAFKVL